MQHEATDSLESKLLVFELLNHFGHLLYILLSTGRDSTHAWTSFQWLVLLQLTVHTVGIAFVFDLYYRPSPVPP